MLEKTFLQILNMSITASFVIIFVLLARLFLKKSPKILSYALWGVVLFRLICPFSFESIFSLLPAETNPISQDIVYEAAPTIDTGIPAINHTVNQFLPAATPDASVNTLQIWAFIGSTVWLLGIAILLIYSIVSLVKLQKRLKSAVHEKDNIYLAKHLNTPFVMGFISPKIYLPAFLTEGEKRYILLHEQMHIRRFDHVIKIASFFVLCLHWFNPLVWIAFFISGKDMEMSCDEAVIKKLGSDVKKEYSSLLLTLATGRRIIGGSPLAFGEGDTKGRIKNVLNYKKPAFWMIAVAVAAAVIIAVGLVANPVNNVRLPDAGDMNFFNSMTGAVEVNSPEELWNTRTKYIGDNSAISKLIGLLPVPEGLQYDHIKLHTSEKPYEIEIVYSVPTEDLKKYDIESTPIANIFRKNALLLLALVDNAEGVRAVLTDGMREVGFANDREWADYTVGGDVRDYAESPEKLQELINLYNANPIVELLTQDQAVVLALTSRGNHYLEGECFAEGHIILGTGKKVDATKIYALTMIGHYGFQNDNFVKVSGTGVIPAVVTLGSNNDVSIEYPKDGNYYAPSIREMFPLKYHTRIFSGRESDRKTLKKQERAYAKEYLSRIGRKAEIGDYGDFEHTLLTDLGVSVEVSNKLEDFYKKHSNYPYFIGTQEYIENNLRMVYQMSYDENQKEIKFIKHAYNSGEILEQFVMDATTGDSLTPS